MMEFIKFHSERNIKFSEVPRIIFNNIPLLYSLKKRFPKREITLTNYGRTAFKLILDYYEIRNCKVMIPAFICSFFKDIFKERKITPVIIDVEKDTFNISARTLKKNFDDSAFCLITNNMNGLPCEIEKIKKILGKKILIEDCAHSLGAFHKGKQVGLFGDAAFFSLYKNLPSIKGGFAVTKKRLKDLKREKDFLKTFFKFLYYLGKVSHLYRSFKNKDDYEEDLIFENIKIKRANIFIEKLASFYVKELSNIIKSRQNIAYSLKKALKGKNLKFQKDTHKEHIYTYFSFLLPKNISGKRSEFLKILRKKGIVGRIIWNKPLGIILNLKCPNTKEIAERIVGIPINPHYSPKEINNLSKKILNSLSELKK